MISAIYDRRSIRKFSNKPISQKDITDIIQSGIKAPSSKNRQPWKYIVIQGKSKEEMLKVFRQGIEREENERALLPQSKQYIATAKYTVDIMSEAPNRTIIVNDLDYERLEEIIPASLHGKILMYRFQEWEKAEPVIQEVTKYFNEQNKIDDLHDTLFYSMSSRMEEVNKANESGYFLIILALVILCMFYMAANIILYYSQKINIDKTKEFYTKLYFIGMKQKNIMKLEHFKNCVIFIAPGMLSIFIAIVYSYSVNKIYLMANVAAFLAGCVIMIIILMQFAVAYLYTEKEYFFNES